MTLYEQELARGRDGDVLRPIVIKLLELISRALVDVTQRGKPPDAAARDLADQVLELLER